MVTKVVVADQFFRDAHKLQKRYPNILKDVRALREQLTTGEQPGDRLQGLTYKAYKVRLKNSDAKRGKSGGYRAVYYVETAEQVVMITIYSKSDQSDIATETLRQFIAEYEAQHPPET
ncbi:MAG: type II toxin-antitoxin system RelE/ParE family toxin [Chloroflexota bacterium]